MVSFGEEKKAPLEDDCSFGKPEIKLQSKHQGGLKDIILQNENVQKIVENNKVIYEPPFEASVNGVKGSYRGLNRIFIPYLKFPQDLERFKEGNENAYCLLIS